MTKPQPLPILALRQLVGRAERDAFAYRGWVVRCAICGRAARGPTPDRARATLGEHLGYQHPAHARAEVLRRWAREPGKRHWEAAMRYFRLTTEPFPE